MFNLKWFTARQDAIAYAENTMKDGEKTEIRRFRIPISKENMANMLNGRVEIDNSAHILTMEKQGDRIVRSRKALDIG
jgi:hypothetical protein